MSFFFIFLSKEFFIGPLQLVFALEKWKDFNAKFFKFIENENMLKYVKIDLIKKVIILHTIGLPSILNFKYLF
jgi:hypothetical protein